MRGRRFLAASAGQLRRADQFFTDLMGSQSVRSARASRARLQADRFLADLLGTPAHALRGLEQESPEWEAWSDAAEEDPAKRRQRVDAFFNQLKKDLTSLKLDITGVTLVDMQQHAQYAKLKMFNAWLNSATELYINVDDAFSTAMTNMGGKRMAEVVYASVLVRHELNHVEQFKTTGGPPKTYREMCNFEKDAYAGDARWMNEKDTRAALKKLGMDRRTIDAVIKVQEISSKAFEGFAKLPTEAEIKAALTYVPTAAETKKGDGRPFLPCHDTLAELYKAK